MKNEGPLDGRRAGPNPILKYYRSGSFHGAGWRKEVSSGDHERRRRNYSHYEAQSLLADSLFANSDSKYSLTYEDSRNAGIRSG
jgi:hypothetical protein